MGTAPLATGFEGVTLYPGYLDGAAQADLLAELAQAGVFAQAYRPTMPRTGKPWSITQFNLGPLGWVSDISGYRYEAQNPHSGTPWPAMPDMMRRLWDELSDFPAPAECCLVNLYTDPKARMGLHQDRDEAALEAPVLSLSLGDTCVFRVGGFARGDKSSSFRLASGDVLLLGGASRLRFHGVDRVIAGSSQLIRGGGRLNLTLRRVTKPDATP
ncbi:MAG: alpha-ketoglutarate-dependent dioxygenase AlkB [Rhizobiales bacterium]|nr:alpha-ketoglutarate-dependent dioxygenase AlkB [Hyphomicrobiales bacterium]